MVLPKYLRISISDEFHKHCIPINFSILATFYLMCDRFFGLCCFVLPNQVLGPISRRS